MNRRAPQPHPWASTLIVASITAITTTIGSFFLYKGTAGNTETEQLRIFIENQIAVNSSLNTELIVERTNNTELQVQIIKLQIENGKLQQKLGTQVNELDVIRQYLEDVPVPAWIKIRRLDGTFEMLMLNEEYSITFNKKKSDYEGYTDYAIYPRDLAEKYQAHDQQVYETGQDVHVIETIIINEVRQQGLSIKFRVNLPDGKVGIGGLIILSPPK